MEPCTARFWFLRGRYDEGRGWLQRFPKMDDQVATAEDARLARALTGLGGVIRGAGDRAHGVALLAESLALFRAKGDPARHWPHPANLGSVVANEGDFAPAEHC
jgi:hypothetical protein